MSDYDDWLDSLVEGKNACPKCREKGRDNSGDNFHYYGKGKGGYCHACEYTVPSEDHIKENSKPTSKIKNGYSKKAKPKATTSKDISMSKKFDKDDWLKLRKELSIDPYGYRGLDETTCKKYDVLHAFDEETGELTKQYYPTTVGYKLKGCGVRTEPKDFFKEGASGNAVDLFGQAVFKNSNSKDLIITGGELDALSGYQMFEEFRRKDYEPVPFVSPTNGETGAYKQLQYHYEWLDSFERIILCFDNDKAGREAVENAVEVLPRGKIYILKMSRKDPNEYLEEGDSKAFWNAYWRAEKYVPNGITASTDLEDKMLEYVSTPRVSLPPFMRKLMWMLVGGFPIGYIVNILAACVDADTEYFNGEGWVKIRDYKEGDLVSQYSPSGDMELVTPTRYIKEACESMTRISTPRGLDQVCSDEHRFIYWQPHKKDDPSAYKELYFKDLISEHLEKKSGFSRGAVKTTFNYQGSGINYSEGELRLQVAIMADGRIVKEGKDNYTQMRFKKERKYKRLLELCNKYDLKFSDRGINNQGCFEVIVWGKSEDKYFNKSYYSCTREQLAIIVDELLWWDGCYDNGQYSTTRKENADFIQFAYACLGKRATISVDNRADKYTNGYFASVCPTSNNFVGLGGGGFGKGAIVEDYKTIDGFKYCFEVPSGMLVMRRNGKIFVTGNSGVGKSTIVNAIIIHWLRNFSAPVGVVSLEASEGEYGVNLASSYCKKNINLIEGVDAKIEYLMTPEGVAKRKELWEDDEGNPNFYIVDADIENMQSKCEYLIRGLGCKIIVFDPVQDILDELTGEEQAKWMKWEKDIVKKEKVIIINISHARKSGGGAKANSRGAELNEEDMMGHSSIFKSGGINIVLGRDKEAECPIEQNTTIARITKARGTGKTGKAGEWLYVPEEDQLYDKEWYLDKHPNYLNSVKNKVEEQQKTSYSRVKDKPKKIEVQTDEEDN